MKLTVQVKLQPTEEQYQALEDTLTIANEACNYISAHAWKGKTFGQYSLHKLVYHEVRALFPLSAQMVVRAIAKVADAYKLDRDTQRTFKPGGGIAYDNRILSWKLKRSTVSIWTTAGRLKIPFVCGERQRQLLKGQRGETDLVLFRGNFYLNITVDVEEPKPDDFKDVLGVDLGIAKVAVDSDGETFSGSHVNNVRHRHRRLRKKLQEKGTKSAKRKLKKLSGKEKHFARDLNHVISKRIVTKAKDTYRAIALETLTGIRDRVTVRRSQRATLHSWAFYQLKQFIAYKAKLAGVTVLEVDPRNTSRTCPICGCIDKRNRPTQDTFLCASCNFSGDADHIAACNIAGRAVVNLPNVSSLAA